MKDISGWDTRLAEGMIAHHRAAGHWRGRTLADDAREQAMTEADRVCITAEGRDHTVGSLVADAEALAAALWELGLRPGQVLSFQLPNWPEAAVVDLAAVMLGLIVNPVVPIYRDAEVGLILADCRARVMVIPDSFRGYDYAAMMARLSPKLPDLERIIVVRGDGKRPFGYEDMLAFGRGKQIPWPAQRPEAIKMIMYTSGTTGRPKGVLHSHETLPRAINSCCRYWGIGDGDVILMPSPVTHVTGFAYGIEMPFCERTRTVFMERWNAGEAADLIDRHDVRLTVGATPFLQELIEAGKRAGKALPSLRIFGCGGAAVPAEIVYRALDAFPSCRTFRIYGSTEAPVITLGFVGAAERRLAAETDGRIVDYEVKLVDPAGVEVAPGQEGEILARGPALFLGYADAAQSSEAFDQDGFFRTGDIGWRTPEDALVITGRIKDLIIRGGENLSAKEIEDALHRHPLVREAAVVAMPHARLGEAVCAYVIPSVEGRPALAQLNAFLEAEGMARQKYPEHLELVDDFPRTASGKIKKDTLRAMIAEIVRQRPAG